MRQSFSIRIFLFLGVLALLHAGCGGGSDGSQPVTVVKSAYTTKTADGWEIALKRYRRSTGTAYAEPILVSSGYFESSMVADAFKGQSLVRDLALQGHDVWTFDIRNSGDSQKAKLSWDSFSVDFSIDWTNFDFNFDIGFTGWDYGLDHLVVFDMPAAVDKVLTETGASQLHLVGHSMGALMTYGYLTTPSASKVRSAVTIGGVGFFKPGTDYTSLFAELFFEIGTFIAPLLPDNLPLPLKWALDKLVGDDVFKMALLSYALDTVVGKLFWNHENINPNLVYQFLKHGLPNTTTNCFKQFLQWADAGDCVLKGIEFDTASSSGGGVVAGWNSAGYPVVASSGTKVKIAPNYNITKLLPQIKTPLFILSGSADFMCPPGFCKEVYNRIGSKDKSYHECSKDKGCPADFGHVDLVMGLESKNEVYPRVRNWLGQRSSPR